MNTEEKAEDKPEGRGKWKCRVCGCMYEGELPPQQCPVCHKSGMYFQKVFTWKCRVCEYTTESVNPPAKCPVCHVDSSHFDIV